MPLDPSIPLNAMGANPQQPQQQFGNALQVFQLKDAMQQRNQQQMAQVQEKRIAKKLDAMTNRATGLWIKYQSLKDQGFSEQSAHAAMQEDWKRELGGLASERFDDGSPLFDQQELGQFGGEFNAGELGMILPKLMGSKQAMDAYFKTRESPTTDQKNFAAAEKNPAFRKFLEDSSRSKATQVNVNTGQMPLTKPVANETQKDLISSTQQLGNLRKIKQDYQESFLTYGGKFKNAIDRTKAKVDPTSLAPEDRKVLGQQTKFNQEVNRVFNAYRKEITGAAAAMAELDSLKKAMLNTDLSGPEFEAAYESYESELQRTIRLKRKLLREGVSVADEKQFGQAFDSAFTSGDDDDPIARGEELEAQGAGDDKIVEMLREEGYID